MKVTKKQQVAAKPVKAAKFADSITSFAPRHVCLGILGISRNTPHFQLGFVEKKLAMAAATPCVKICRALFTSHDKQQQPLRHIILL